MMNRKAIIDFTLPKFITGEARANVGVVFTQTEDGVGAASYGLSITLER
jgi:hypothetical protein